MSVFSERLAQTRNHRGIKQQTIASELRVSRPAYSQWETGRNEPPLSTIVRLCHILDVSADYLLGLSDTLGRPKTNTLPVPKPADPFSDLTPEQRTVMETTLNAFRQQNAAARE